MGHQLKPKIPGAPEKDDIELVTDYFSDKCNCYAYAVQDYLAGHLSEHLDADFNYLPRPGQTRGKVYQDLKGKNIEGMRRAIHEDGLNFAGMTYPKHIPENHYVICCFLEPTEYHFIRQNQDGSWSSKNGLAAPTTEDAFGEPLIDPENFYHGDKDYPFVGYFFVPQGGIQIGAKAFEKERLAMLRGKIKIPAEKKERVLLEDLVRLTDKGREIVQKMQNIPMGITDRENLERGLWEEYYVPFEKLSRSCLHMKHVRRNILKTAYTRPKQATKDSCR